MAGLIYQPPRPLLVFIVHVNSSSTHTVTSSSSEENANYEIAPPTDIPVPTGVDEDKSSSSALGEQSSPTGVESENDETENPSKNITTSRENAII